jgi:GTP cyclohydrolase I
VTAGTDALASGIRAWLTEIGADPAICDETARTPERVAKSLSEFTTGYDVDVPLILSVTFDVPNDGMIIVTDVPFVSMCAHHLLPFEGTASIAYLPEPGARIVGLSKLARTLDAYARRLQTQENISTQVTAALDANLKTLGSACVLSASHSCMAHRGVRKPGSRMVTSSLTGKFRSPEIRAEFLSLISR